MAEQQPQHSSVYNRCKVASSYLLYADLMTVREGIWWSGPAVEAGVQALLEQAMEEAASRREQMRVGLLTGSTLRGVYKGASPGMVQTLRPQAEKVLDDNRQGTVLVVMSNEPLQSGNGSHWMLAVVEVPRCTVTVYDPLSEGDFPPDRAELNAFLQGCYGRRFDWTLCHIGVQENCSACGPHAVWSALELLRYGYVETGPHPGLQVTEYKGLPPRNDTVATNLAIGIVKYATLTLLYNDTVLQPCIPKGCCFMLYAIAIAVCMDRRPVGGSWRSVNALSVHDRGLVHA